MRTVDILAIESSCDETAASVVRNGREVRSNIIYSQTDLHALYGGVVPEIASRNHIKTIDLVVKAALREAGAALSDMDAVAVTAGPGLVGALLVGLSFAKGLSFAAKRPLIGVHHIKGHVAANYIEHPGLQPPFLCLIVSGGHTNLVMVKDYREFEIIGKTADDAAGEAFDKVARSIGLGYPGGPLIDKIARMGNDRAIDFPKAKVHANPYDFSFSGLKSAVLNYQNIAAMKKEEISIPDLAASFQRAVVEVLTEHTLRAAEEFGVKTVALAGGVAANSCLRNTMEEEAKKYGIRLLFPSLVYCTDNAAMIGSAAYFEFLAGNVSGPDLNAVPGLKL